jgi:cobalamin biosynthesis Mg chelatase CobN
MHLLATQAGAIQQDGEAIDLGQTPGEIVLASSADSELTLLAGAADRAGYDGLRLANLLRLGHNLSVDLWLEQTVRHARLVVVRLLGGPAYWQYGVDELIALAATRGPRLALLPGDATPDPILRDRSTIDGADWDHLFALLVAGGPDNAAAALAAMRTLDQPTEQRPVPRAPASLPRFGLWQPPPDPFGATLPTRGREKMGPGASRKSPSPLWGGKRQQGGGEPETPSPRATVPLLFYSALLEGSGTAVVEALAAALEARHLAPLPLFVSSLKEAEAVAFVRQVFAENPPEVILNLTGFALGLDGLPSGQNPFAGTDAPVLQLIQGGRPAALWAADSQGLSPKDLAMQVVMPELDGRIGSLLVGHKAESQWHERTQCPLTAYAPDPEGIARAADLAASWVRLRQTPRAGRRIGIVLANYPIRDGRLANGVGYDAPQSTVEILRVLDGAGYGLGSLADSAPSASERLATPTPDPSPQGGGERRGSSVGQSAYADPAAPSSPPPLRGGIKGGGTFNSRQARPSKDIGRARSLRLHGTPPERRLWLLLRELRPLGYHFRRQVPIGRYFADFACHHPRLVVELDGDTHAAAVAYDAERTAFLETAGYTVLRIGNRDVVRNLDGVGQTILNALTSLATPAPDPSPQGGGERRGSLADQASVAEFAAPSSHSPLRGGIKSGGTLPSTGNALIELLQSGPTNAHPAREGGIALPLARYRALFAALPAKMQTEVTARWGVPEADPFVRGGTFHLPALRFGNVAILLQPARGYDRDDAANYHDPDLVPPHAYLAAYLWLRHGFAAHALIHNGKHGNLEWLPGKAAALDAASYPATLWGGLPHLYPFIVNDPGEGTQAKRRTGAVIIDHLVPPLTRAETYGPLKDLEALLDEYYAASGLDRRRLADLRRRILAFARDARLDEDVALPADEGEALKSLDNFLCELKEAQIRDGLHVFGQSPAGGLERDLIVALARVPRGENGAGEASLIRALADDLKLAFDPLSAKLGEPWTGPPLTPHPSSPARGEVDLWHGLAPEDTLPPAGRDGEGVATPRTTGDVVEHLESLAAALVDGTIACPPDWAATRAVLATVETVIRPRLRVSGPSEIKALLDGLDGKFVAPGPSGAPSRGRLDVLPTGRNFYSVDNRAVPTPTAWELGRKSAENLLVRHLQDHGIPLRSLALSAWGTANMRTGGDDIAQALAFIGARPVWDPGSLRVSGYEIIPLARLGRPRVDVTLKISGFFRDAFPAQIALFDRAVRAVGALDEPAEENPIAARMRTDALGLIAGGASEAQAAQQAGYRIFGSKPGAYGAGLQGLMDSGKWQGKADLAEAFLKWGQYAYGARDAGVPDRARFAARLSDIEAVVHNQDNREHDLLDSDDYYQFEGGLAVTAETLTGQRPAAYHNDHSRPERPLTRTLEEEISRVMRSRVVNPKWIAGVKRHGYKGAFEIIATVDYMFAFAATTGAVKTHHFDLAFEAFVEDDETRQFLIDNNRFGYDELLAKFAEARRRGLWTPRGNRVDLMLDEQRTGGQARA